MNLAEIIGGLKEIYYRLYAITDHRKTLEACLKLLESENALIDRVLEIIDDEISSWEQIRDELGCKPEDDNAEAALALARSRISELMKEGEQE